MEAPLITIDEVREVRSIPLTFNQDEFNAYVSEIQRIYVSRTLGYPLYKDLLANTTESKYINLLDGVEYTYNGRTEKYYGLKLYIIYLFLELITTEGGVTYQEIGKKDILSEFSANQNSGLTESVKSRHYRSARANYLELIQFLDEEQDTYPLWNSSYSEPEVNRTNNFRVIGNSYYKDSLC